MDVLSKAVNVNVAYMLDQDGNFLKLILLKLYSRKQ